MKYKLLCDFEGWGKMPNLVQSLIDEYSFKNILEVGAGANPTLEIDQVMRMDIQYTINDILVEELEKADSKYEKRVFDLCDPAYKSAEKYDFIFSRMVAEHVPNGQLFYKNIYKTLKPGGITVHCMPTLYTLPFVMNLIMSGGLSEFLLDQLNPRSDKYKKGKFKAYYSWARGPTRRNIKNFQSLGYDILEYTGYFGHSYYKKHLYPLHFIEELKSSLLHMFPIPLFTSYAKIVLRKPL